MNFPLKRAVEIRADLIARKEIALLDTREEALHATGHPLFAANLPLGRIELEAYTRLPRRSVPIVVFDNGEKTAQPAAELLHRLGYTNIALLEGNLQGWIDAGYELFRDVNAPSKAFGELVEEKRGTPSFTAPEVQKLIEENADYVIVDARRFEEYQTMSIPTGVSVPGAELVLRIQELAPRPETRVIVNCAGRTRSIIGTQSLINAGIPNPVVALRNGAIGWRLAKQRLAHGASESFREPTKTQRQQAAERAKTVANRAGVIEIEVDQLAQLHEAEERTTYFFDVRTPAEYETSHLAEFVNAPGGQLVQETDMYAPVRGARIVLMDTDGARARMTGSWLRQMGWETLVVSNVPRQSLTVSGVSERKLPPLPSLLKECIITLDQIERWSPEDVAILDFSPAIQYNKAHVRSAWFASRVHIEEILATTASVKFYVVTADDDALAAFAFQDLALRTHKQVFLLDPNTVSQDIYTSPSRRYSCKVQDRYMRPYEGVTADDAAMQAYLDWEAELVAQLDRDGTHHFFVI